MLYPDASLPITRAVVHAVGTKPDHYSTPFFHHNIPIYVYIATAENLKYYQNYLRQSGVVASLPIDLYFVG